MISTGCQKCDEKLTGVDEPTLDVLCDEHKLEYFEHCALVAVNAYLNAGLDGDPADYNYRKAKWAQRRARLANLYKQIELDEIKESKVKL